MHRVIANRTIVSLLYDVNLSWHSSPCSFCSILFSPRAPPSHTICHLCPLSLSLLFFLFFVSLFTHNHKAISVLASLSFHFKTLMCLFSSLSFLLSHAAIGDALRTNTTLTTLKLQHQYRAFSPEAIRHFIDCLQQVCAVCHLPFCK